MTDPLPFPSLPTTRRLFLRSSLGVGGAVLAGCTSGGLLDDDDAVGDDDDAVGDDDDAVGDDDDSAPGDCTDPFAGGTFVREIPMTDGGRALDTNLGEGLDGRRYYDLRNLDTETMLVSNENFYIRTIASTDLPSEVGWTVRISGLVDSELEIGIDELRERSVDQGARTLECSGNGGGAAFGLLSAATWAGVPLSELLEEAGIQPGATMVRVTGFDTYPEPSNTSGVGASWVFRLDAIDEFEGFLATQMNGEPLPRNHGRPVRLMMPRWYGCSNIKWVEHIELVDDSTESTGHMLEFAGRTHQNGAPAMARDFLDASMDQAAMPIKVEQWELDGETVYRIIGVMWGGYELTDDLSIRFEGNDPLQPVAVCPAQETNTTWTLWEHLWRPDGPGFYDIELQIEDPTIRTRRLDTGFYIRPIEIEEA